MKDKNKILEKTIRELKIENQIKVSEMKTRMKLQETEKRIEKQKLEIWELERKVKSLKEDKKILKNKHIVNISMMEFINSNPTEEFNIYNNEENIKENKNLKDILNHKAKSYNDKIDKIERSIIKQLIYSEKDWKIPYSKIKKEKPSRWKIIFNIISLILFIILIGWFFILTSNKINKWYTWTTLSITLSLFGYLIYIISNYFIKNYKISKISLAKVEANIEYNNYENAYNHFLDEIIYFFKKTKYNVVVFEDIDRYNDVLLFSHLRELNSILNNSKYLNKHITFIFAVREDIFKNKDKHKFFDYIIPVVPIVDYNNSFDKLREFLGAEIENKTLKLLSRYIYDFRIIKDIMREYNFFFKLPSIKKHDKNKLISILFLKNLFPQEFIKFQYNESVLEEIVSQKYNKILNEKIRLQKSIEECEKILNCDEIYINPKYTILGLLRDFILSKIENLHPNHYLNILELGVSFYWKDLFNANIDVTLLSSLSALTINSNKFIIDELMNKQINKLINWNNSSSVSPFMVKKEISDKYNNFKNELSNLNSINLCDFYNSNLDLLDQILQNYFNDNKNQKEIKSFISALILNDLLNENYKQYISINWKKQETNESIFIKDFYSNHRNDFYFELTNVEEIINELGEKIYNKYLSINYSIIIYFLKNNINNLKKLLSNNVNSFSLLYDKLKYNDPYLESISNVMISIDSYNIIYFVLEDKDEDRKNKWIQLILISDIKKSEIQYIPESFFEIIKEYDFNIFKTIDFSITKMKKVINNLINWKIVLRDLSKISGFLQFQEIIDNSLFEFNYKNLLIIDDKLDYQNLSSNINLKSYVDQNIQTFVEILLEQNIKTIQSKEFHELINNNVQEEILIKYYENNPINIDDTGIFNNDEVKIVLSKNNIDNLFLFLKDNKTSKECKIRLLNILDKEDILNRIELLFKIIIIYKLYDLSLVNIYKILLEKLEDQNNKDELMENILDILDAQNFKKILKSYNSQFKNTKRDIIIEANNLNTKIFNKIKEIDLYDFEFENNFYVIKLKK